MKMNFTNTDRVRYNEVFWHIDEQVYKHVNEQVLEQMRNTIIPMRNTIRPEINK
jgi:hypothetical protein